MVMATVTRTYLTCASVTVIMVNARNIMQAIQYFLKGCMGKGILFEKIFSKVTMCIFRASSLCRKLLQKFIKTVYLYILYIMTQLQHPKYPKRQSLRLEEHPPTADCRRSISSFGALKYTQADFPAMFS